jgi:RNA polymerase sigma-70 factor (ECF subfamily)
MSLSVEDSDHAAMARLRAGDDLALNEIIDRWQRRVTGFLLRMTGNETTAVDLVQETFVRVYQSRDRFQPKGEFSTWLFAIAANLGRHHFRWHTRHPTVSLEVGDGETHIGGRIATNERDPSQNLQDQEVSDMVRRAILSLPDDLREVVILSHYEELSHQQIATVSGCTAKAIETRLYRAKHLLRERLSEFLKKV